MKSHRQHRAQCSVRSVATVVAMAWSVCVWGGTHVLYSVHWEQTASMDHTQKRTDDGPEGQFINHRLV